MKLLKLSAAIAAICLFAHGAEAREHRHAVQRTARHHHLAYRGRGERLFDSVGQPNDRPLIMPIGDALAGRYNGSLSGRPAAWCGWMMRQLVGSDPGPAFNLARNWAHWGQPGPAGIGAIVVWSHHVGRIVGEQNGQWVIQSGNDGHALRARPRSIAGAIAIRWG